MSNQSNLDPWQYRISLEGAGRQVGRMFLEAGPGLSEVALEDSEGTPAGLLLGFPIDLEGAGRLTDGTHRLGFAIGGDVDAFVERVLDSLGGRFIFLCTAQDAARVYLDCIGQVSCVYDTRTGIAGASAYSVLSPQEYDARFNQTRFDRFNVAQRGWFPGGMTAHDGVKRVLPNHMLDFDTRKMHRHWPPAQLPYHTDPDAAVEEMIEVVRIQMKALHDTGAQVAQGITAGYETRMMLGCAKPFLKDTTFMTVVGKELHQVDTVISERITAGEGLTHIQLPRKAASEEAQALYLRRNGHCLVDTNGIYFPSIEPISATHILIGGAGGEIGRALLWRPTDKPGDTFKGADLPPRFGMPQDAELIEALDAWIAELPPVDAYGLLDLLYMENRWGPWFGAQFASDPTMERYAPLLTRRTVALMLAFPPEWKKGNKQSIEMIRATWPELLEYPFNSLGPVRDILLKIARVIREPHTVVRRIRKRLF